MRGGDEGYSLRDMFLDVYSLSGCKLMLSSSSDLLHRVKACNQEMHSRE